MRCEMPKEYPCGKPLHVVSGSALIVTAVALSLITMLVAKGAFGAPQIGVAGAVTLSLISLVLASVGGFLIGDGVSKKTLPEQAK